MEISGRLLLPGQPFCSFLRLFFVWEGPIGEALFDQRSGKGGWREWSCEYNVLFSGFFSLLIFFPLIYPSLLVCRLKGW